MSFDFNEKNRNQVKRIIEDVDSYIPSRIDLRQEFMQIYDHLTWDEQHIVVAVLSGIMSKYFTENGDKNE